MMKHLYISALLLMVSVCASAQTGAKTVKRDGNQNQVVLSLTNGEVKYYNTADLQSIDFNSGEVTFKHYAGNDSYKNMITGMRFLKSEKITPMSEDELSNLTGDLVARMLALAYNPQSKVNDAERIDYLLTTLCQQQIFETRGVWSQAKAIVDFGLVMNDANKLHRCTVIGAMSKFGHKSKADRQRIWRDIMDADVLPNEYRTSSDQFWKAFSMGELDYYAIPIYKAIMDHNLDSPSTATEGLATDMANNGMRHIDLTLAVAPQLIEAGANIVFAFGGDLIETSKLAYDFFTTNGEVVFEVVEGNLTAETFIDACNNNLKLLAKGLEEIIPDGGDLAEMLADATAEQVKQLNKEINDAITFAGRDQLSPSDVAFFVGHMRSILNIDWAPGFLDKDYVNKDKSFIHITSNENKAYVFHYYDAERELIWGGKCSIDPKYIFVQTNVLDEKCDLLRNPKEIGDIVAIPYTEGYQSVSIGSSTDGDVKYKMFSYENVEDQVVFHGVEEKNASYYNSEYQLYVTEYNEGHYMEIRKYLGDNTTETIFSGYYTASESLDLGVTISSFKKTLQDGSNTIFANEKWKSGDLVLGSYYKNDDGIIFNIEGHMFELKKPIDIEEGKWRTPDGLAEFELGRTWGYYRCFDQDVEHDGEYAQWRLYLMLRKSINQFEKTVRFSVSYAYNTTTDIRKSVDIMLPTQDKITVECKDYNVPFKLETKKGVQYLTFTLFGYEFVLHKTAD